jgi:rare lipoprotein A
VRRFRRRRRRLAALVLLPLVLTATTASIALAASASSPSAVMSANQATVKYGERVRLAGSVPGLSGADVQIAFQRNGAEAWRTVHRTSTDPGGGYEARVRQQASGLYRAHPVGGQPSEAVPVRVRSVTKLSVKRHVVIGNRVKLRGRVLPGSSGREVKLSLPGSDERARTSGKGRFKETWRPNDTGRAKVRAAAAGNSLAAGSSSRARRVTVYRPASASWYGPGLYGNRTACGGTLSPSTVGVAHRSMPCGTKLTLRHRGRSVRAKVIDRGPFVAGREFDLTGALKNRLGFGSTGTVLVSR